MIEDEVKIIYFYISKISSSFRLMSVRSIDLLPSKNESKNACEEVRKDIWKVIWGGVKANQHYKNYWSISQWIREATVQSKQNTIIFIGSLAVEIIKRTRA